MKRSEHAYRPQERVPLPAPSGTAADPVQYLKRGLLPMTYAEGWNHCRPGGRLTQSLAPPLPGPESPGPATSDSTGDRDASPRRRDRERRDHWRSRSHADRVARRRQLYRPLVRPEILRLIAHAGADPSQVQAMTEAGDDPLALETVLAQIQGMIAQQGLPNAVPRGRGTTERALQTAQEDAGLRLYRFRRNLVQVVINHMGSTGALRRRLNVLNHRIAELEAKARRRPPILAPLNQRPTRAPGRMARTGEQRVAPRG